MQFSYNGSTSIDCKKEDENFIIDRNQIRSFYLWTTGDSFWLASRYVYSNSTACGFCIRYVNDTSANDYYYLFHVYSSASPNTYSRKSGLRPCILLRENIKITGGDGKTEATAYTIE